MLQSNLWGSAKARSLKKGLKFWSIMQIIHLSEFPFFLALLDIQLGHGILCV